MAFPSYTTNGVNAAIDSTPSPFVTLISSNGQEFHIRRSAALVSGTIRRMLDPKSMLYTDHSLFNTSLT